MTNPPADHPRENLSEAMSRLLGRPLPLAGWTLAGPIAVSHVYLSDQRLQACADVVAGGTRVELLDRLGFDHRRHRDGAARGDWSDQAGRRINTSLGDYLVAVNAEVPDIDVVFVGGPDPLTPIGTKGIGELAIVGMAAAIANAVHHATGVRVRSLPISLDKVMAAALAI